MSVASKTNIFNVKVDPFLDRYDKACHDVSLNIFERALNSSNLPAQPVSILLKTVGLLLTDLITRVMQIVSYLLRSVYYLTKLQADQTKYYLYSALIWGPLTLLTKTASNCSRLFGCVIGFVNPHAAVAIWLTAELIDAFVLRSKIAYTPLISSEVANPTEMLGNALFYFGKEKVQSLYNNQQEKPPTCLPQNSTLDPRVAQARHLMELLKLRNSPKLEAEVQFLIRFHMSHLLSHLFQTYGCNNIYDILSRVALETPLGFSLRFIDSYMKDFTDLPKMMQKKRKLEDVEYYVMTITNIIDLHFYLKKHLERTKQYSMIVKQNTHLLTLESLIFIQDTLFPGSLLG